jgi:Putative transposase.
LLWPSENEEHLLTNLKIKSQKYLARDYEFENLLSSLYAKKWVVYCKPPFKNASCVVEYLGRYTHRVAIANSRIICMKDGKVTFKWRDYKDGNKLKIMTLSANEFIRRFLIHILPDRFTKIRHYGLLGNPYVLYYQRKILYTTTHPKDHWNKFI